MTKFILMAWRRDDKRDMSRQATNDNHIYYGVFETPEDARCFGMNLSLKYSFTILPMWSVNK